MIDIDQARELVLARCTPNPPVPVSAADALGHTLAEDATSDIDSPPHDKALMDGYAVRTADLQSGRHRLRVLEEVVAGDVPQLPVTGGAATRIMTGAPIPAGADAVVILEQTGLLRAADGGLQVDVSRCPARPWQNILRRGTAFRRGARILRAGAIVRPIEVGLLCEAGCTRIRVIRRPRVSVLPTGDELVAADTRPGPGQIRNSNGPLLAALVRQAGGQITELPPAEDQLDHLRDQILAGLRSDVLLLSGGVSAGDRDLVPEALHSLAVERVFHKVRVKPGKPLWFGLLHPPPDVGGRPTLVFGLPGNPVSSLVCFELFVRPALARILGRADARPARPRATLSARHVARGDRPAFLPARLSGAWPARKVQVLRWHGSADLRTLADADCLAHIPAGDRTYEPGDSVEVHLLGGAAG
jgi:molybdopterin molybdotransferase